MYVHRRAVVLEARGAAHDREGRIYRVGRAVGADVTELRLDAVAVLGDVEEFDPVHVGEAYVRDGGFGRRIKSIVTHNQSTDTPVPGGRHVRRGPLLSAVVLAIHIKGEPGVDVCDPDVVGLSRLEYCLAIKSILS